MGRTALAVSAGNGLPTKVRRKIVNHPKKNSRGRVRTGCPGRHGGIVSCLIPENCRDSTERLTPHWALVPGGRGPRRDPRAIDTVFGWPGQPTIAGKFSDTGNRSGDDQTYLAVWPPNRCGNKRAWRIEKAVTRLVTELEKQCNGNTTAARFKIHTGAGRKTHRCRFTHASLHTYPFLLLIFLIF